MIYQGAYAGSSFLEYFNTTAQTLLFSLSKHLHTPAFFFPLSPTLVLAPRTSYSTFPIIAFNLSKQLYLWMNFLWMLWLML